jgi:hypothetical protein
MLHYTYIACLLLFKWTVVWEELHKMWIWFLIWGLVNLIWCGIQSIMLNSFMDTLWTCRYSNNAHTILEGLIYLQDIGFEILLGNHLSYWDHHGSSQLFHINDKYHDIKGYVWWLFFCHYQSIFLRSQLMVNNVSITEKLLYSNKT